MDTALFNMISITRDINNIVTIRPNTTADPSKSELEQLSSQFTQLPDLPGQHTSQNNPSGLLDILENFASLVTTILNDHRDAAGIIYYCPVTSSNDFYQELFEGAKASTFLPRIQKILKLSNVIKTSSKPVVAIIDQRLNSHQLTPMLWASHIIATDKVQIALNDCKLGIFPAIGVTVYSSKSMDTQHAASLLIANIPLTAKEANCSGLLNQIAKDKDDAFEKAIEWIAKNASIEKQEKQEKQNEPILFEDTIEVDDVDDNIDESDFELQIAPVRKKTNRLFPGINPCIALISKSKKLPLEEALDLEAKLFTEVLRSKEALGIMRTMNYGIQNAKSPERVTGLPDFSFNKISVLGAGMMGSGIAYEVARAGISVWLKDTDKTLAANGKVYTEKCCDKLIQLGKMSESKKEEMLSLIHPTDIMDDLSGSDLIIEAVFEDRGLKENVISESKAFLNSGGFFASNTTSLPISKLATYADKAENFIGMHFFSPVDRMPLVEIIRGRQTSYETVNKAIQLALRLQKVPIVVHDSPAFFTSRIFFNYLLEAITMLLEGIPASDIEVEAINAGFAVSPLAVLDEISIPLMLHVYDQLPNLTGSQKRCYTYLSKLVSAGRSGRKSKKGFYNYETDTNNGSLSKQIWQDESLTNTSKSLDKLSIQKRLLHVMALDSYRLLQEGVLDQPIDGDIGSILGVGYAAHTGGVFAYIDEVGISQFVQDCISFRRFGEQWEAPSSLQKLAEKNFEFYNGFTSNWSIAK